MKKSHIYMVTVIFLIVVSVLKSTYSSTVYADDPPVFIPDNGIGFNLRLPANLTVDMPTELQSITIVTIYPSDSDKKNEAPVTSVTIVAERLPDYLSYEEWRNVQATFDPFSEVEELSTKPVNVAGQPGLLKYLAVGDSLIWWETEILVNHVVYRILGPYSPQFEQLYQTVVDGIEFTGLTSLPPNDLLVENGMSKATVTTQLPDLKFPFNGTKTITCAYHVDNSNCHNVSRIALDFNLR